jgi:putative membrane protein
LATPPSGDGSRNPVVGSYLIQSGFSTKEVLMRWIYLGVIILFAAAIIIFALQNFEIITMSVFGFDARVPLAVLVAVAYLLGAATGGSLFALLRRSYEGSRRRVVGRP